MEQINYAMSYKIYKDSIGEIKVESDKLWGATTQRSFEKFKIGNYKMPTEVIRANCSPVDTANLGERVLAYRFILHSNL